MALSLIVALTCEHSTLAQQQQVVNGGFEAGLSNWTTIGNFYANCCFPFPHTGNRYLYLTKPDANPGDNLLGATYQQFTIPSDAVDASLQYWWNVSSEEGTQNPVDVLNITIQDSSGNFLSGVGTYSNLHQSSPGQYQLATFNLAPFAGQTIRLHILGFTNGSNPTVFRLDDISVLVDTSKGRGGIITQNTTWTQSNSPYVVTDNLLVTNGATLDIKPRVVVKFDPDVSITVGDSVLGPGTLKAIGTSNQPIKFTTNLQPSAPGQWLGLLFTDTSSNANFDSNGNYVSGSVLKNAILEYAGGSGSGIQLDNACPLIAACEIRYNLGTGITSHNHLDQHILRITGCNIHANTNGYGAAGASLSANALEFTDNTVSDNASASSETSGGGLHVNMYHSSSLLTFDNNVIVNNHTGTHPFASGGGVLANLQGDGDYTFANNTVAGNEASGGGGGLFIQFSTYCTGFSVVNNVFDNNSARAGGGLLLTQFGTSPEATVVLASNSFSGNTATGDNTGNGRGGAFYVENSSTGLLKLKCASNSFFSNQAESGPSGTVGHGGAIYAMTFGSSQSQITLTGDPGRSSFNSFAGNSADKGDAIYNSMPFSPSGSGDIHAQLVCWGADNPLSDAGLIFDHADSAAIGNVLVTPIAQKADCLNGTGCGPGLIEDCNGNCAPIAWIGDGVCDNGDYPYQGVLITFACSQFDADGGDCVNAPQLPEPDAHDPPQQPNYDDPKSPDPGQNKLVYVVHGCCTSQEIYKEFWVDFANAIDAVTGPDWKVEAVDWTSGSGTPVDLPTDAAHAVGLVIGTSIGNHHYEHVHLIGHSMGCYLIAVAAHKIKTISPETVIHTTFLDAYYVYSQGPYGTSDDLYGGFSAWSDHYFSTETVDSEVCLGSTGDFTQQVLPESHNVDVSFLDPDYGPLCLSDHTWPRCFYRSTVNGDFMECDAPDEPYGAYGFHLSREFVGSNWSTIVAPYTDGLASPPGDPRLIGNGDSLVFKVRRGAPLAIAQLPYSSSPNETMSVAPSAFTAHTLPNSAWITAEVEVDVPINLLLCDFDFDSENADEGLLTAYVDGESIGFVDERYVDTNTTPHTFNFATVNPGLHTIAFRLVSLVERLQLSPWEIFVLDEAHLSNQAT